MYEFLSQSVSSWLGILLLVAAVVTPTVPIPSTAAALAQRTPALEAWGGGGGSMAVTPDEVAILGAYKLRAHRPLTVLDFEPATLDARLAVLAVRAVFYQGPVASGHLVSNDWPGSACTDRWPPRGFGGTYPLRGLHLEPGDHIGVLVYLRARDGHVAGHMYADGLRVSYHAEGRDGGIEVAGEYPLAVEVVDASDGDCARPQDVTELDPRFPA